MMKKFLLLIMVLLLALPCLAVAEAPVMAANGATLTVSGSASVTLKADYAQISVGVSTTAKTVDEAVQQNTELIHQVITALQDAGVADDDIVTSSYSVYAEYDYSSFSGQKLAGYNVTNQLSVIIRDMEHIGATLDKATAAGANNIYNIDFRSTKANEAQDEATLYAVQDAMRKAQLLAQAAGLQLGGVVSVSESSGMIYAAARTYKSAMDTAAGNAILPDDASVSASVTMVFELK